jgi:hypothetical protein
VEVLELLVGEVGLLEKGGELLLAQITPLLSVAYELTQLVGVLKGRYLSEKYFVFRRQPYVPRACRKSIGLPTGAGL